MAEPEPHVTVAVKLRRNKPDRWAYTVHIPGSWAWTSPARYTTADAAQVAGDVELRRRLEIHAQLP